MSGFTPGPWEVCVDLSTSEPIVEIFAGDEGHCLIGRVMVDNTDLPQARADARLIASAPDLVETLLTVREAIETFVDVKDGESGPLPNWAMALTQKIDAALTKAGIDPSA